MKEAVHKKKSQRSAARRVLRAVGTVFLLGWMVIAILLLLLRASWQEFIGSMLLLGGFFISWILTIFVLKHKDPKLVDDLLNEVSEEEGKRQENLVSGGSSRT